MFSIPTVISAAGFYASASGGFVNKFSSSVSSPNTNPEELNFSDGCALNASLGYLYKGFRFEGEILQSTNEIDSVESSSTTVDFSGKIEVRGYFLNVFWNYITTSKWAPYLGGGIGNTEVYMNNITNNEANFTIVDEKDTASAFQFFLGVTNNLLLKADYRYLNVGDVSYTGRLLNNNFNQEGPELHILAVGLLYKF